MATNLPTRKCSWRINAWLVLAALALGTLSRLWAAEPVSRRQTEKPAPNSALIGSAVRISEGAVVFADLDVLKEAQTALAKGENIAESRVPEWIKRSRVFVVGINSAGIVTSVYGPRGGWVEVEANINGKADRVWAAIKDISLVAPELQTRQADQESGDDLRHAETTAQTLMKKIFNERLDRVEVYANVDGGFNVLVFFNAADGWSIGSMRRSIERDMRDAYRSLYTSNVTVTDATMFAHAKTSDKFGKESSGLVYKTHLSKETAKQVIWEKADSLDFTEIWETGVKRGGL
jgi:hypothetical protein